MCGLRDVIDSLIQHATANGPGARRRGVGEDWGWTDGPGDAGSDSMRVYSFLFDLVDQHLLPRFPEERAGGHLEVAVHASVLIRQAVQGMYMNLQP